MGTAERRDKLLKILCQRRYETIPNLAQEIGVSPRTIQRDIEIISLTEPIYTKVGRIDGGVYIVEGFYQDRMYMNSIEIAVLKKLKEINAERGLLDKEESDILDLIILHYTRPTKERNIK